MRIVRKFLGHEFAKSSVTSNDCFTVRSALERSRFNIWPGDTYLPPPCFGAVGAKLAYCEVDAPRVNTLPVATCASCQKHGSVDSHPYGRDVVVGGRAILKSTRLAKRSTGLNFREKVHYLESHRVVLSIVAVGVG